MDRQPLTLFPDRTGTLWHHRLMCLHPQTDRLTHSPCATLLPPCCFQQPHCRSIDSAADHLLWILDPVSGPIHMADFITQNGTLGVDGKVVFYLVGASFLCCIVSYVQREHAGLISKSFHLPITLLFWFCFEVVLAKGKHNFTLHNAAQARARPIWRWYNALLKDTMGRLHSRRCYITAFYSACWLS